MRLPFFCVKPFGGRRFGTDVRLGEDGKLHRGPWRFNLCGWTCFHH
jgi:hypothetical protein